MGPQPSSRRQAKSSSPPVTRSGASRVTDRDRDRSKSRAQQLDSTARQRQVFSTSSKPTQVESYEDLIPAQTALKNSTSESSNSITTSSTSQIHSTSELVAMSSDHDSNHDKGSTAPVHFNGHTLYYETNKPISLDPRDDLPAGGYPEPNKKFYIDSLKKVNWTKAQLTRGFNITVSQYLDCTLWLAQKIAEKRLQDTSFATNEAKMMLGPTLDAFEERYTFARSRKIPRIWRYTAMDGWARIARDVAKDKEGSRGKRRHHHDIDEHGVEHAPKRQKQLPAWSACILTVTDAENKEPVDTRLQRLAGDIANGQGKDIDPDTFDVWRLFEHLSKASSFNKSTHHLTYTNPEHGREEIVKTNTAFRNALIRLRRNGGGTHTFNMRVLNGKEGPK